MTKEASPCEYCDDTGDVHSVDGEWRGRCTCEAGAAPALSMSMFASRKDYKAAIDAAAKEKS